MEQPRDFSELESRLTDTARASFERAGVIAQNQGSPYVGTEHILLGILAQNSSLGAKILAESGVTLDRVETALELTPSAVVFAVEKHPVFEKGGRHDAAIRRLYVAAEHERQPRHERAALPA